VAEHVTQYEPPKGSARDERVTAVLARFGDGLEVRGADRRSAETLFAWLAAAKGRLPVATVRRHVCRHDEDIGACTIDQEA
jgi:hypothetical protein